MLFSSRSQVRLQELILFIYLMKNLPVQWSTGKLISSRKRSNLKNGIKNFSTRSSCSVGFSRLSRSVNELLWVESGALFNHVRTCEIDLYKFRSDLYTEGQFRARFTFYGSMFTLMTSLILPNRGLLWKYHSVKYTNDPSPWWPITGRRGCEPSVNTT